MPIISFIITFWILWTQKSAQSVILFLLYVAPLHSIFYNCFFYQLHFFFLLCLLIALITVQVQEKKVKRVAVMNLDSSQSVGSSTTAIASTSSSKAPLPNGGCSDKFDCLNNDLSFPPGGYPSLRLPVVSYTRHLIHYLL